MNVLVGQERAIVNFSFKYQVLALTLRDNKYNSGDRHEKFLKTKSLNILCSPTMSFFVYSKSTILKS